MKFNLHKQANASLNSGIDLKEVVKLPPGEDMNDWIAVHGGYMQAKADQLPYFQEYSLMGFISRTSQI